MPKYKYTAKSIENKMVHGSMDARDEDDLKRHLKNDGMVALDFSVVEGAEKSYRMKLNEVAEFSRQMASMLGSGITVTRALEIIKERDFKVRLKAVYNRLYVDVQNGLTLSEAMREQGHAFPELFINMYATGEASGQLENSAKKMAVHYDKEHRLNGKIKAAMFYPIILFGFTVVIVFIIFIFILPEFFKLFEDIEIPPLTVALIAFSTFLKMNWHLVLIGILIFILFVKIMISIPKVALLIDRIKIKIPVIGKLLKIIYTARFSRTLSSLYSSGLPMINALDISSTVLGNSYIHSQFPDIVADVRNGEPMSNALKNIEGFDSKLCTTILIGEESGRLDTMLESTAESFDYEAEMATQSLVALIEPIMIVFMAAIICIVMLSVMQPIITLYQNVG